jgi:hypothetical protein
VNLHKCALVCGLRIPLKYSPKLKDQCPANTRLCPNVVRRGGAAVVDADPVLAATQGEGGIPGSTL